MSKTKIIAGIAAAASLGVAILPAATFAATTGETQVNAIIEPVISMELKTFYGEDTAAEDQTARTTLAQNEEDLTSMYTEIRVSTNSLNGFVLTLIDEDDNNNLVSTEGNTIAAISGTPAAGTNPGWAVRIDDQSDWLMVPAAHTAGEANSPITVKSHNPGKVVSNNVLSTVHYGVATAASQPTGTYVDSIVYTATAL